MRQHFIPPMRANLLSGLITSLITSLFTVAAAADLVIVPEGSEARYRVTEQIANRNLPNDAVGVTPDVSGTINLDDAGKVLAGSGVEVGLDALHSDQSRRDGFLRRNTLQTNAFPNAVFVPTELRGLDFPLPTSGSASFEITGMLTIRDVTRPVVWQAEATFDGDTVRLAAQTSFTFDDFGLDQPRVPLVLSIDDTIGLEVTLTLRHPAE